MSFVLTDQVSEQEDGMVPKKLVFSPSPTEKLDSQNRKIGPHLKYKGKGLATDDAPRKLRKQIYTIPTVYLNLPC